jgi:hypothetical protein
MIGEGHGRDRKIGRMDETGSIVEVEAFEEILTEYLVCIKLDQVIDRLEDFHASVHGIIPGLSFTIGRSTPAAQRRTKGALVEMDAAGMIFLLELLDDLYGLVGGACVEDVDSLDVIDDGLESHVDVKFFVFYHHPDGVVTHFLFLSH